MSAAVTSRALAVRRPAAATAAAVRWLVMDPATANMAGRRHAALTFSRLLSNSRAAPAPADKAPILEKPEKFNPPSHGTRLPRKGHATSRHYGGEVPQSEVEAQSKRQYPTMMAPKGTWAHYFWTNSTIHSVIAITVLTTLGITTFFLDFTHTSPYRDLVPPLSDAAYRPIQFVRQWCRVLYMAWVARSMRTREESHARVNDAVKRRIYLKAHGAEPGLVERLLGDATTDVEAQEAMEEAERKGSAVVETAREEAVRKRSPLGHFSK